MNLNLNLNNLFINTSSEGTIIRKFIYYSDNRVQASFDDKTSIIIHAGYSNFF